MKIDLGDNEKVTFLISVSQRMGVSADDILAVYLLLGDKIFFLFDLFQGRSIKFPSMRSFHHILSLIDQAKIVKLTEYHYIVNGVDSYKEDINIGDTVQVDGIDEIAMSTPITYLGETCILMKKGEDNE